MPKVIEKTEYKKGYKKTKLGWIPEDWNIFKFSSIFERINRRNCENNNNILTISANYGLVNQEKYFNKVVASSDTSNYLLLHKGEFAYNKSYSSKYPMGAIKLLEKYEKGIVSNLYICFVNKPDIHFSKQFFKFYFDAGRLNREIYKIAQEGARNHGLLNMSTNNFFNTNIIIPTNIKEQEKIAEILSAWDDGIETLEKLIEQKEILKTSLAQKYFQRKNNSFSQKQHKLGELFKNRKETNCCDLELLSVCDGLGIVLRSQLNAKDNSNENKSKYLKVCIGDLAYNTMRMWQGRCGVSSYEGIVSPAYTVCIPKNNIDVDYMYYLFKTPHMINDFWRYSQGIVDDTLNLKFKNFEVIKVWIPEKKTQTKIAKLLKSYDEEIQLLNSKLEKLKEQKKGLMQKLLTGQIRVKV
jgi:type I restriction enzyme, S subunit